jgi:hypothetical protein
MSRMVIRTYGWLWLVCGAIAALADVLFYKHPWGVNSALFGLVVVIAVVVRSPGLWRSWMGRSWVLLAGMALLALVEEPSPLAVLMAAVTIGTLVLVAQGSIGDRVTAWAFHWGHLLVTLFLRLLLDNAVVARWVVRHPQAGRRLMAAATAIAWWVFPLAAGGIFLGLFAIANPIIGRWVRIAVEDTWTVFDWLPLYLAPERFFLWFGVALGAYGILRYRRRRTRSAARVRIPPVVRIPKIVKWWNGQGMIIRCLVVFNAVFAVQTILDVVYLYGGAALPSGMTYAHYAHRGAYPLVFTAILAGAFVLAAFRHGGAAERSPWARRLVYLWIVQNLFLLVSTIWRIWLYVDVYSLTRLRVSAMIWVVLVALGFCWIVAKSVSRRDNTWLWRMNALTLFTVLLTSAFINFDGLIADFNVRHCKEVTGEGAPIDYAYLRELGPEALPALRWLGGRPGVDSDAVLLVSGQLHDELQSQLKDWRGWSYRRWREANEDLRRESFAAEFSKSF